MNRTAFEIRNTETERAINLSKEAQKISTEINYREGLATALNNEGFCYVQITDYGLALEKCLEALRIFSEIKNEKGVALTHYNLGITYMRLGDYTVALNHISQSMEYHQKVNDQFEIARCYLQLGFLYGWMHDLDVSVEVYTQGLEINREIKNKAGEAACLMGLGQTYLQMKEFDKSGDNLFVSMRIRKEIGDMRGYAASMNAYMTLCLESGKYEEGEKLAKEGAKLATELGDRMGISRFMVDLGSIYMKQDKLDQAEKTLLEALDLANKINLKMVIPPANLSLSEIYQKKGDFRKALTYYQNFHAAKEELYNTDAALKAKSIQLTGKIEKANSEAEINRLKNVELKNAFDIIAEKNKDITDSINYARRIQQALLASQDMLKRNLKDFFVLYRPKDIVSGDFYWASEIKTENDQRFYLAVCDCTGHGVPGAFMSLLNISYLNEAITEKNIHAPNQIFDHVRDRLIGSISSDGGQDGMDATLVSWDKGQIKYTAAHNAPVVVKDGKIIELEADKMPVGKGEKKDSFKKYSLDQYKGGVAYLFTDGFADQFGGPKGKKFKYKPLKEKILANSHLPLEEQKNLLEKIFDDWKGDIEQTDDMLIIGIKL